MQPNTVTAETLRLWCEKLPPDTPVAASLHGTLYPLWSEHLGWPEPLAFYDAADNSSVVNVAIITLSDRRLGLVE